jgi:hypothetical protein
MFQALKLAELAPQMNGLKREKIGTGFVREKKRPGECPLVAFSRLPLNGSGCPNLKTRDGEKTPEVFSHLRHARNFFAIRQFFICTTRSRTCVRLQSCPRTVVVTLTEADTDDL